MDASLVAALIAISVVIAMAAGALAASLVIEAARDGANTERADGHAAVTRR